MSISTNTLNITLSYPSYFNEGGGSVMLEQETWNPYTGHLTKMQVVGWLGRIILNWVSPSENCRPPGDGWGKYLYAYPYPANLRYRIGVSHGNLGQPIQETLNFTELLRCNLELSPALKFPPLQITSAVFEGDCYTAKGEITSHPRITITDAGITLSAKVYASLRITYLVRRFVYPLTMQSRTEYQDKKYQSFFWAAWVGGTKYIEVEAPFNAESKDEECLNKWGDGAGHFTELPGPGGTDLGEGDLVVDDKPYGHVTGEDEYIDIDYCSQKQTS